jgi:hypothetical protein
LWRIGGGVEVDVVVVEFGAEYWCGGNVRAVAVQWLVM